MMKKNILTGFLLISVFGVMSTMQAMQVKAKRLLGLRVSCEELKQETIVHAQCAMRELACVHVIKNASVGQQIAVLALAISSVEAFFAMGGVNINDTNQVPDLTFLDKDELSRRLEKLMAQFFERGSDEQSMAQKINALLDFYSIKLLNITSATFSNDHDFIQKIHDIKKAFLLLVVACPPKEHLSDYVKYYYPDFRDYADWVGSVASRMRMRLCVLTNTYPQEASMVSLALACYIMQFFGTV